MGLSGNSDQDEAARLMARVILRDRAAFAKLYALMSPGMMGYALHVLKTRAWAEEALQDTYIRVWIHAEDYQADKASVRTWMTTILRNRCFDLLRVHQPQISSSDELLQEEWATEDLTPLEMAAQNSEARALLNCMKQLAPKQRQAIALSFFYGMAHEQLARHLTEPLGTIKSWLRRGLQSLKLCLTQS